MRPALLFVRSVLLRDWHFLAATMLSCIVAATVATFQYSVYNSFRMASAVVPRALGADFWIKAASVECFDFPTPFSEDFGAALQRYVPDSRLRRVVVGFVPWRSPTGRRGNVALVGIEGLGIGPASFLANRSDLARLDIDGNDGSAASVANITLTLAGTVDALPTYLGAPYVLADLETARRLMGMDATSVAFLAGNFTGGRPPDLDARFAAAHANFPDVEIASGAAFEASSIAYWQRKTGAGLAIGLAAILALLLMILLLANGVLRFIQRYYNDFLSILGHGAGSRDIAFIVAGVATAIAFASFMGAALVTPVMVLAFTPILPWVSFAMADLAAPLAGAVLALAAAILAARRAIAAFGPDAVFRT